MANGSEIAQAYVQIIPSTEGISNKIQQALGGEGDKAGKSFGSSFASSAGKVLKVGGVAIAAGLSTATAGITAMAKNAISAYGDFEQLSGGVETLFKTSSDAVMKNAEKAFKTAGLSANEYMETVTSFSASLIGSLGGDTEKAAKIADKAIVDMADNANKMGTSMEMIQNAYQGFAKQNYTMLDNLKLGYGGTKTEMQRLLKDAQAISGIEYNLDSYADVVEAIHVIQDNLGITGTTAKEATETIQGSFSMLASSWQNFMAGIANPDADMSQLASDLVESAQAVIEHLVPIIAQTLPRITDGLVELVNQIVPMLPGLIDRLLPGLIQGAVTLMTSLATQLPTILRSLVSAIPQVLTALFGENGTAMGKAFMGMFDTLVEVVGQLGQMFAPLMEMLLPLLSQIVLALEPIISALADALMPIIQTVVDIIGSLMPLLSPIIDILTSMIVPIINLLATLLQPVLDLIAYSIDLLAQFLMPVIKLIADYFTNVTIPVFNKLLSVFKTVFNGMWDVCKNIVNKIVGGVEKLVNGVIGGINGLLSGISKVANAVGSVLGLEPINLQIGTISLPKLEKGGILERGQIGLLEGNGAEAVVPLENNSKWISAVARDMDRATASGEEISILEEIRQGIENLQNMNIVMDTGATVGALAMPMNNALGRMMAREGRR